MRTNTFFVSGDDWGLVEITPAENRAQYEHVALQYAAHHKDTVFSPNGWTTPPFIIPTPQVSIAARSITIAELESLFANLLHRADVMQSCEDTTGKAYDCDNGFAFYVSKPNENSGLYGTLANGTVDALYLAERYWNGVAVEAISRALLALGGRYALILVSHGSDIVDLTDEHAVFHFLRDEEEE